MTRLVGHGLRNEGAAYNHLGERIAAATAGPGRAKCECGELSEVLPSGAARRRWHAGHKSEAATTA